VLKTRDLVVEYPDGTRAVDTLNFFLREGENVALIGANGAGKTSLLLSLAGVLPPAGGDIYMGMTLFEESSMREIRSQIGITFQNPDDQFFMPTVYEDVAVGARNPENVSATLSKLGIDHVARRPARELSDGDKRLAAIATVLIMEPEFILLDEPTAYLDPRARRNLIYTLMDLPQGMLIATHDTALASILCNRVLLMENGRLVADEGTELLHDKEKLEAAGL